MFVTLVHVHVKAEHLPEFIAATRANREDSIREPGCLRFDVIQMVGEPARFVIYEAFRDEDAAKAHKATPHYATWRDAVADWMAEPRFGVRYDDLFPSTAEPGR
jgi:autoinducer 2-degrading protein